MNFDLLLEDLEAEYPKHQKGQHYISANYGRPMRIITKDDVHHSNVYFRWEHQTRLGNQELIFNINNTSLLLKFENIKEVKWD
jgi:hypothetical protein